ncbi:hypothetical protein BS17DRAFT_779328 [Gyrodon lividus]|nr:hypothetical protein BS17DRAFT_779328 [Gyrodon lividus]
MISITNPVSAETGSPLMTEGNSPSLTQEKFANSAPVGQFVYRGNLDRVERQLGRQHIQMSLAGTIGTGLFLGLGEILSLCGPLGSLIVYVQVSTVIYATISSVGEMTAYAPISGSLLHYAARWLDPAVGFAGLATGIPLEITAFSSMVAFWDPNPDHTLIYIAVFIVALFLINLFGVRYARGWFGKSIIRLFGSSTHSRSSLEPGASGRFLGLLVAIGPAAFSVTGIELIAITAAEAKQPRTNIIKAMKTVIFRLVFFYIFSVIVVGMLVPSNDPALLRPGASAWQSPFVIAFERVGITVLPSIINAVLITSSFSAANTFLFTSSRILYGLAVQNQAPEIFTTCTKGGLPWIAMTVSWLFAFLAFISISSVSGTVFNWFVSLAVLCAFLGWLSVNITYLRYFYGLRRQGIVPRGIYRSPLQPYASMWAIFWIILYILMRGISLFWNWSTSQFIISYINLPAFFGLLVGYKLLYRTKITPLADLDFVSNVPSLEETGDGGLLLKTQTSTLKKLGELI